MLSRNNSAQIAVSLLLVCILSSSLSVRAIAVFQDIFEEEDRVRTPEKPVTAEQVKAAAAKEIASLKKGISEYEHVAACEELARLFLNQKAIYRGQAWSNRCLRVKRLAAESPEQDTRQVMLAASLAYLSGDTRAADKLSARAVQAQENYQYQDYMISVPAHLQRASILRAQRRFADALKMDNYALNLAVKHKRFVGVCKDDLATSLEGLKKYDEAAKVLGTPVKEDDDWIKIARFELSRLLIEQGKFDEALKIIEQLITKDEYQSPLPVAPVLYRKSVALHGAKKEHESRSAAKESVAFYLKAYGIGGHYLFEPLQALAKSATSVAPDTPKGDAKSGASDEAGEQLYQTARKYLLSGNIDLAMPALEKAYQSNKTKWGANHPYTADVLTLRGIANEVRGQRVAALADYNQALLITEKYFGKDDGDVIPLLELIAYSELTVKPKDAVTHCTRALEITKANFAKVPTSAASIYELLGDACKVSGLNARAVAEYNHARQIFRGEYTPSWCDINRLQQKLEAVPLTASTAGNARSLPTVPADGHLFEYQKVSDWREGENWRYRGELSANPNIVLKSAMLQPPPDVIPTFIKNAKVPSGVEYLDLSGARKSVVDAWLSACASAPSIKRINLNGAEVDDSVIDKCVKLAGLTEIDLSDTTLSAKTVAALGKVKSLTSINLSGQTLMPADIAALAQLPALKKLVVSSSQLPATDLVKLSHLEYLDASSSNLTDAAAAAIGQLSTLSYLDISSTGMGDGSVDALARMPRLQKILLGGAKFTANGKQRLFSLGSKRSLTEMQG